MSVKCPERASAASGGRLGGGAARFADQQPTLAQQIDRRQRAADRLGDFGRIERFFGGRQQIDDLALLGRKLERVDFRQRVGRQANEQLVARAGLPAHAGRNHGFEHLPPGAKIIVGHPLGQPQHRPAQQAPLVDHLGQRLEALWIDLPLGEPDQVAGDQPIGFSQRHADPATQFGPGSEPLGNEIVQRLLGPGGKDDRGDELFALVVLFPGRRLDFE